MPASARNAVNPECWPAAIRFGPGASAPPTGAPNGLDVSMCSFWTGNSPQSKDGAAECFIGLRALCRRANGTESRILKAHGGSLYGGSAAKGGEADAVINIDCISIRLEFMAPLESMVKATGLMSSN